ncbi:MAG: anhydro-N-acetylmuramic acid kinase [Pseudomonadota bacterium]
MLQAEAFTALGTMSGTSLDGVDAAVLVTDGVEILGFGPTMYRPYSKVERAVLRASLGYWHTDDVRLPAALVEAAHLEVMRGMGPVDIGGFHGQTLAHDPNGRGTHQCGNGQILADALGYPVVWDFRAADVAAGGQGAPLAPFYHFALAKWIGADAPVVFLNLGGVGNITWVDPRCDDPADPGALLAFDTGPANAPMNDLMQDRLGKPYDAGGKLAKKGTVRAAVIEEFATHPYFSEPAPKSLDRDAFAGLLTAVAQMDDADALATLAQAVVVSVARGLTLCPEPPARVFVMGGGRQNKAVMKGLKRTLGCPVKPIETAGLNGDMIEAQAFAYLAVRSARGLPLSCPQTTGVASPCQGGRLAEPFKSMQ